MLQIRRVLGAVLVLVAACGGGPKDKPPVEEKKKVEIVSFQADPANLPEGGGTVTLTWKIRDGRAASIEADGETIAPAEPVEEGSLDWEIHKTTRFRLIATGEKGYDAREIRVEVEEPITPRPPVIGDFLAEPAVLSEPGGTVRLRWTGVRHAQSLRIERERGSPMDVDASGEEGSAEVIVEAPTTFTLVAENPGGEARKTVSVGVVPLPVVVSFWPATPTARRSRSW